MKLEMIDSHCHINFRAYRKEIDEVIGRALSRGIGMIAVGTQRDTSREAVELAKLHQGVWAIIGLHPIHLFPGKVDEDETAFRSRAEKFDSDYYRKLIEESGGKAVGLGECGIDYYHVPVGIGRDEFISRQKEAFTAQLELAHGLGLPVMVHCREAHPDETDPWPSAHEDIISCLAAQQDAGRQVRGNIHCFSGSWDQASRYLALGFYISFTGIVTFPPRKRDLAAGLISAQELAGRIPLDRILAETDSPYLAPVPHRGQQNEPAYVRHVVEELANIHGLSSAEMAAVTLENTDRLFGLGLT